MVELGIEGGVPESEAWTTLQRGGTLENSGEMIGWELRELRVRVTKNNEISKKFTDEKQKKSEKKAEQKKVLTKIAAQISPGGGLSEGLRGTHGELRELSEGLSEGLRGTQGRTQGLRGLRPPILENSGGTSPRGISCGTGLSLNGLGWLRCAA